MTAKEYLMKIAIYRAQLTRVERHIEELYASADGLRGIAYDGDKVQSSPTNALEQTFVRIDAQRAKWERLRAKYDEAVRIRIERISALEDPRHVELLSLRYVDLDPSGRMQSFEKIADKMGYSLKHIWRLHGEALEAFRRRYKLERF